MITELAGAAGSRIQSLLVAGDNAMARTAESGIVRLGSLMQRGFYVGAKRQTEFFEDSPGIRNGRWIRHGGSGADDLRIVAHHVRNHQRFQTRREGGSGKLAALDHAQVLADGVHFVNRRATGEQPAG